MAFRVTLVAQPTTATTSTATKTKASYGVLFGEDYVHASDVAKAIKENEPQVDVFVEKVLLPKFLTLGNRLAIPETSVNNYFQPKLSRQRFTEQLERRGFYVKYGCDDCPCGSCQYLIGVPPQEE